MCVPLNRLFGRFSTFDEWVYGAVFACLHVCTRVYFPEKVHIINSSHHHHLEMEAHNIKFKANSGNFWLIFHYLFGYLWKDGLWQWVECACVLRVPHELSLQIYCWGLGWKMMVGKAKNDERMCLIIIIACVWVKKSHHSSPMISAICIFIEWNGMVGQRFSLYPLWARLCIWY